MNWLFSCRLAGVEQLLLSLLLLWIESILIFFFSCVSGGRSGDNFIVIDKSEESGRAFKGEGSKRLIKETFRTDPDFFQANTFDNTIHSDAIH